MIKDGGRWTVNSRCSPILDGWSELSTVLPRSMHVFKRGSTPSPNPKSLHSFWDTFFAETACGGLFWPLLEASGSSKCSHCRWCRKVPNGWLSTGIRSMRGISCEKWEGTRRTWIRKSGRGMSTAVEKISVHHLSPLWYTAFKANEFTAEEESLLSAPPDTHGDVQGKLASWRLRFWVSDLVR